MADNKIMTIEKAMFILRHGSAEGEHKYFEAVDLIEKEYNRQQAEIENLKHNLKCVKDHKEGLIERLQKSYGVILSAIYSTTL